MFLYVLETKSITKFQKTPSWMERLTEKKNTTQNKAEETKEKALGAFAQNPPEETIHSTEPSPLCRVS